MEVILEIIIVVKVIFGFERFERNKVKLLFGIIIKLNFFLYVDVVECGFF